MSGTASRLCFSCGEAVPAGEQFVLADGRRRQAHCSEACVRETVRRRRAARRRFRLKLGGVGALAALLLVGGFTLLRHRAPKPRSIALSWVDVQWDKPTRPEPINDHSSSAGGAGPELRY